MRTIIFITTRFDLYYNYFFAHVHSNQKNTTITQLMSIYSIIYCTEKAKARKRVADFINQC